MSDGLNQARALRLAEILNDYRTLLLHISQQNVQVPAEDYWEEGYAIIRDCLGGAQALLNSNYSPAIPPACSSSDETEKLELQRVILDASARRFQAHRIYLRAAAARRWAINRDNLLHGGRPTPAHAPQLKAVSNTLSEELAQVTDQHVVADLRAADTRAGHWLDDDPSLSDIMGWIQAHS
ncbi:hypothetical protein BDW42DRAFT_133785 [Aspergillus taichungensis]|uniref:Uncharacterized protein n=1 Tax=Aspergillus taichungensis TaxID=482145 RepID=A0A2J5I794_9EURO|nr:hypothetical protein BDW42DRAFT_133785 [Aspergillus taichungensis]